VSKFHDFKTELILTEHDWRAIEPGDCVRVSDFFELNSIELMLVVAVIKFHFNSPHRAGSISRYYMLTPTRGVTWLDIYGDDV